MHERLRDVWIPGICFLVTLSLATILAGAVLLAPWVALAHPEHPLIKLYAHDMTVRRTSLASALGLVVTAFVFFRPPGWFRKRPPKSGTPGNIAGA
jgi:hypothetical protein